MNSTLIIVKYPNSFLLTIPRVRLIKYKMMGINTLILTSEAYGKCTITIRFNPKAHIPAKTIVI